jgi:hypothetical protein
MATNWADVVKNAVPIATGFVGVAGVWVGSRLNARAQRQAFLRERIVAEINRRREVGARFKKSLWIYARRVQKAMTLAGEVVESKAQGKEGAKIVFDLEQLLAQQMEVIEAFADLEHFSTIDVQVPARDCMEALTACFNAATELNLTEARGKFAFYQQRYEVLMTQLNAEGDVFNAFYDASLTPVRRILFRRMLRQPPPYKVPLPPSELRRPGEGVRLS